MFISGRLSRHWDNRFYRSEIPVAEVVVGIVSEMSIRCFVPLRMVSVTCTSVWLF